MNSLTRFPTVYKIVIILTALAALLCGAVILPSANKTANAASSASAEVAMELSTGRVLHASNADEKLPMASTTKIMTAIIVIEDCDLDEVITVPDAAVGVEGSSVYLKKDEKIDIRDLVYGLMLRSGNDCAATLAIHHSGSIEKFAEVMNERAKNIGAENTNFKNPSGLPDAEHYTTASDLCKIACYAMKNDLFKQVVSTLNYKGNFRSYANKNKMLKLYEGANGVKTGYTVKAGRCLVSSAERNGMDVVCVVLNCPDTYGRSSEILDYCFNNFSLIKIDGNRVFISGKVLCKLKNECNIVTNKNGKIRYEVSRLSSKESKEADGAVAKLKIFSQNDLIFEGNLFTI